MKFGERLKTARKARSLTQTGLSEISGVSQSLISQLESSETATGSEYTNRLATALNINPDWLADELGKMEPTIYTTSDAKIIAAAKLLENMPEYAVDAAIKRIAEIEELIAKAKDDGDGTHG